MAAPHSEMGMALVLEFSHRLTTRVSLHTFAAQSSSTAGSILAPSQHITLQFPADLDPIAGSHNLSEAERRLAFTPFSLTYDEAGNLGSLSFLSGNGRVSGLIGLPRPQKQLVARLVDADGGFPHEVVAGGKLFACVAGGIGMACFLSLASSPGWRKRGTENRPSCLWTIRGDDFALVEFFLDQKMLRVGDWSCLRIFVTSGDDAGELTAGKPAAWWQRRFDRLRKKFSDRLGLQLGRLIKEDLDGVIVQMKGEVLFCGSKSLEWQVKMWSLGRATVQCTQWQQG